LQPFFNLGTINGAIILYVKLIVNPFLEMSEEWNALISSVVIYGFSILFQSRFQCHSAKRRFADLEFLIEFELII
jgi:hypothetical protein